MYGTVDCTVSGLSPCTLKIEKEFRNPGCDSVLDSNVGFEVDPTSCCCCCCCCLNPVGVVDDDTFDCIGWVDSSG